MRNAWFPVLLLALLTGCGGEGKSAAGRAEAATVTTTLVQRLPWQDSLEALGTASANESLLITAKVTETVVRVNFADGDLVDAGQVLVDLSGRVELAGLNEAAASFREAEQQYRRQQQLTEQKLVPASQLDTQKAVLDSARARLDATRARLSDRVITAPFAGVLGFRQVSPGTLVTPGTTIASLDDISVIKLDFAVPETYLQALSVGQPVRAKSAAYPEREFGGVVRTLDSRVDPVTRAITVRAEVPNPDRLLRPGMLLSVRILKPERQTLVIPEIAAIQVGEQAYVFRVKPDQTVERADIQLGARRAGEVEVLSGIGEGERIVVDGSVKLRPGSAIRDVSVTADAEPAVGESGEAGKS